MDVTFGIITNAEKSVSKEIFESVKSIRDLDIPKYEILIVGEKNNILKNETFNKKDIKIIDFDEGIKKAWITKKKNLITKNANYENIVYQHDYIKYDKNWYDGWNNFGDFKIGMNKIFNLNGDRYRDWSLYPNGGLIEQAKKISGYEQRARKCLLPYNEIGMSKLMYISGAWWIAKKSIMEKFPLNESLCWGQGEDVEWSYRVRYKYKFSININSSIRLLKHNNVVFKPIDDEVLRKMKDFLKRKNLYG